MDTSEVTIIEFGEIPITREGNVFQNSKIVFYDNEDIPTLLPYTNLKYCFSNCILVHLA